MELAAIAELGRRFEIPGIVQVVEGNGGLVKVAIATREAVGELYLHGAHVTSWQPRGAEEVLFVSSKSAWKDGRAIRGDRCRARLASALRVRHRYDGRRADHRADCSCPRAGGPAVADEHREKRFHRSLAQH